MTDKIIYEAPKLSSIYATIQNLNNMANQLKDYQERIMISKQINVLLNKMDKLKYFIQLFKEDNQILSEAATRLDS